MNTESNGEESGMEQEEIVVPLEQLEIEDEEIIELEYDAVDIIPPLCNYSISLFIFVIKEILF